MMHVTLYLDPDISLYHCSYVLAGLFRLAAHGEIALACQHPRPGSWAKARGGEARVLFDARPRAGAEPVPVCIELHDKSDRFYLPSLERVAWYFKRSHFAPDVSAGVPSSLQSVVRPFGLTFGCGSRTAARRLLLPAIATLFRSTLRAQPRWVRRTLREYWTLARLPVAGQFEVPAEVPRRNVVLFQTRLWADGEVVGGDSAAAVNAERIALVEALRLALGARFLGGLVPNAVARQLRPDLLTPYPVDRRSYLALQRTAGVVVYSRGLHHSTAWKLPEYLAASSAIASPPIRNALSAPLVGGVHVVGFDDPAQCAERCMQLLEQPERQAALRFQAQAYYRAHVEPAAHLQAILTQVVGAA